MKVWEEGESVRVFPELCGMSREDIFQWFWLNDVSPWEDDAGLTMDELRRELHGAAYEIELCNTWEDIGE